MREGFKEIVSGWAVHSGMADITDRIERLAEWQKTNAPLQPDEERYVQLLIEAQIARGGFHGDGADAYDYEPMTVGNEDEGECPECGSRLDYKEVIPEADVGCNYCPECGWEGSVG